MIKVLHLPVNIASIPYYTVKGLNELNGIQAKALIFWTSPYQTFGGEENILVPRNFQENENFFKKSWQRLKWIKKYIELTSWADIEHWYFGVSTMPYDLDLKFLKIINKPALVEWLGSDIRIPEIEFLDNPYYKEAFHKGYEYDNESMDSSYKLQKKFARFGFDTIVSPNMAPYLKKELWRNIYFLFAQRVDLKDFIPIFPSENNKKPIIVHSPSAPKAKGTSFVLKAVEELKSQFDFEFILAHGLSREENLNILKKCDIFLDQFIIGDYGMASVEAMAFGKPVVCFIKDYNIKNYPATLPIVNTKPENLQKTLIPLLTDGKLRRLIGEKSRNYVEEYHNNLLVAAKLKEIYSEVINKKKNYK